MSSMHATLTYTVMLTMHVPQTTLCSACMIYILMTLLLACFPLLQEDPLSYPHTLPKEMSIKSRARVSKATRRTLQRVHQPC